jgi:hypothetical protein
MANEMRDAIKGNDHSDIRKVSEAGDTKIAAEKVVAAGLVTAHAAKTPAAHAASAISIPASTGAGAVYTAIEVDGALLEIAGAGRTTETVKGNADKITSTDLYPIVAQGFDTTGTAGNTVIDLKPSNRTPAVTDTVVMITGVVTASGVPVASPAIVTADTAQGVMVNPVSDTGIKIRWGKAGGGVDYAPNTYTIWLKPV